MRRLLGSLFVIAGLLCVGLLPARAAEINARDPLVVLASSEEYESEQILILASPDLLKNPLFQSLLTSYVQSNHPVFSFLATDGIRNSDQNPNPAQPTVGTNESNTQPGGTDSVRKNSDGSNVGSGGDVTLNAEPKTLQLVELYPNTGGQDKTDEYIAIKNTGTAPVSLSGWILKDASGKAYTFKEGAIGPGETKKSGPEQTNITLNNDKDTIELLAPDQQLIDTVTYEKAKQGDTFQRSGSTWKWSSDISTPQPAPVATLPVEQPTTSSSNTNNPPKPVAAKPTPTPVSLAIAQAKEKPDETSVELTGIATVAPGTLGKQFFYIQDETGGIQVYKHDANFPAIEIGTRVHLKGEMSTSGQERRVKIAKDDLLEVMGIDAQPNAQEKNMNELTTAQTGILVKTSGVIATVGSDRIMLEENGKTLEIAIAGYTGIDTSQFTPGKQLEVTGIVRTSGADVKLAPRSQEDLVFITEETPTVAGTVDTGKTNEQKRDQLIGATISVITAGAFVFWMIKHHLRKKQHTYVSSTLPVRVETIT